MEGLGSLLLFAAVFYFMMRFGCGAHMVHGHGGGGRDDRAGHGGHAEPGEGEQGTSARDPVCGMDVASEQGYTKMYGGRAYRFCSRACLDTFEEHPEQYASIEGGAR
jgi:YHS domain-containing protein